jgi:outer membrane protein OmpA-like peptidoglycan-associated protein
MTDHFIAQFQQLLTPGRIEKLTEIFGDEPAQIRNAFAASLPVVWHAVADKASTPEGVQQVLNNIQEVRAEHIELDVERVFSGGSEWGHLGGNLLHGLLGDKESHLSEKIADHSGVKKATSHNILRITALLVMDLLGKESKAGKDDKYKLVQYLHSGMDAAGTWFPAGLTAAGLGMAGTAALKDRLHGYLGVMDGVGTPAGKPRTSTRILPILIVLGLGALLWWFLSGRAKKENPVDDAGTVTTTTVTPPPQAQAVADKTAGTITLPDASKFNVSKGTMEYSLVDFLNDASRPAGKDVWFDFDDVNFDLDKADLTAGSQTQLSNIAAILKAYPNTKVKVGGYTDKTGDEKHNMTLSQQRADAVLKALQDAGVPAAQLLGAEGYGSQFAKAAANASEEERRPDRRMSLSVREK